MEGLASGAAVALKLPERKVPTVASAMLFHAKVSAFRALRMARDMGAPLPRLVPAPASAFPVIVAESVTPLWSDPRPEEAASQFGKVQNLRRAARSLDGLGIPSGEVFSFWRAIGRATARRGYVKGRMLQEGCLVGATGGGLCQLSNALYDVALKADCEIVERHGHSRIVPGSAAMFGRDATVAWNYVDFRFRARHSLRLEVRLSEKTLVVRLYAARAIPSAPVPTGEPDPSTPLAAAHSCATCNETNCLRFERATPVLGRTGYLLDEAWPEFRRFVAARKQSRDLLAIPLDGKAWGKPAYAWDTTGFDRVVSATATTMWRGFLARRFGGAPGRRVEMQLHGAARLAARLAASLTPDMTSLVVSQSLLPFLQQAGHLGGRRVTVLMTRLPMTEIQARLDAASARSPEDKSLADYRAPERLVEAETAALAEVAEIVTPHAEIATLFPGRATMLQWQMSAAGNTGRAHGPERRRIAFPGPAIARKGVAAVRDAARAMDLEVVLLGSDLQAPGFWDGVKVDRVAPGSTDWLDGVIAVVQPALIEDRPRALLHALAAGLPVIATTACGLPAQAGLTTIAGGDAPSLTAALLSILDVSPGSVDTRRAA